MNQSAEKINGHPAEIFQVDQLSDKEVFSFLKSYYTDSYGLALTKNRKIERGMYLETIITLEKLYGCLVEVDDFIGFNLTDWQDACLRKNEQKKKEIVIFYNRLIIDIKLMNMARLYYDFSPRIDAFIRFLDKDDSCKFRSDKQKSSWSIGDFPNNEVFGTVDKFRSFLKSYKQSKPTFYPNQADQAALDIHNAIKPVKKIKQMLFVLKFNVLDLEQDEECIKPKVPLEYIRGRRGSEIVRDLITFIEYQKFCRNLPWICRLTKAELELNNGIWLMVGIIFDSSKQKIFEKTVTELIHREIYEALEGSWLESLITWDIVAINQILNHLGAGVGSEINLPNTKKVSLMLKWYSGLFYGMNRIIQPDNYTADSQGYEKQSSLEINQRHLDALVSNASKTKTVRTLKRSEVRKLYDYDSIWDDKSLVGKAPEYARSLHEFYKWLGCGGKLSFEDVIVLRRYNLFFAYLNEACLDNLCKRLSATTIFKSWPKVVRMYLSFIKGRRYESQNLSQWAVCNQALILAIPVEKLGLPTYPNHLQIESGLHDLQKALKSCEKFQNLLAAKKLVRKNCESGLGYLHKRFKENVVVLRFRVDCREKNIKVLKDTFTYFIKSAKRAPKKIGADLDSYLGYLIVDNDCCYIDFTVLLYIRENVSSDDVKLNLQRYWNDLEQLSREKKIEPSRHESFQSNLDLISAPILRENNIDREPMIVIKGDRHAACLLKNSLVNFYTAYEYFSGYKRC